MSRCLDWRASLGGEHSPLPFRHDVNGTVDDPDGSVNAIDD
jgi:hypothetical protein